MLSLILFILFAFTAFAFSVSNDSGSAMPMNGLFAVLFTIIAIVSLVVHLL